MKRCTKCGIEKEESEFYRDKSKIDGLRSNCKQCAAESDRLYRVENKDSISIKNREYELENRAVLNELDNEKRARAPEKEANRLKAWRHKHKERVRESEMRSSLKSEHPMRPTAITDPILMGKAYDMKQTGMWARDIAEKLSVESGEKITHISVARLFNGLKEEPIPELLESDYPSLQDISYLFNIKFKKEKTATVIRYHNTTMRRDLLQRILTKFYKKNFTYYDVKYECNDRDTDTAFFNHWEYLLHFHYIEHITDTEFGFCDIVKRWHMKLL